MNRFIKRLVMICIAVILVMTATGCAYRGYRGDYAGAYTLIYSQVPDTRGAWGSGPRFVDPQIILLETDVQDRALYLYLENTSGLLSIGIVQKETVESVYFYPEQSTRSFRVPDRIYDVYDKKLTVEEIKGLLDELCSDEILEAFKADNDWNSPMDDSKLDSAQIRAPKLAVPWVYRTDEVNLSDDQWKVRIFAVARKNGYEITEEDEQRGCFSHANWMATDDYGRRLYYVEGYYYVYSEEDEPIQYNTTYLLEMVAIIYPDGTFDPESFMVELEDKANYQEQIRELKLANGWNQPIE